MEDEELRALLARLTTNGLQPTAESDWLALRELILRMAYLQLRVSGVRVEGTMEPGDIAQDLVYKLSEGDMLSRVADQRSPGAYLYSMVRNRIRDELRRSAGRHRTELAYAAEETEDEGGEEEAEHRRALLHRALSSLSLADQRLMGAIYASDNRLSFQEIGRRFGLSVSNVATRHHRIVQRLRKLIDEADRG